MKVLVGHLYPDYLNIYADRGNIAVLERRAAWRGIGLDYRSISLGDTIPDGADLLYIGGGQDREQGLIATDLAAKGPRIAEAVAGGAALLAVCGGYQLLGRFYRDRNGVELPGIGLFPLVTIAGERRMIGDILLECELDTGVRRPVSRTTAAGRISTTERRRSVESSPASGTTARTAARGAGWAGRSGPISTARCCLGTPGLPTGCSSKRLPMGPARRTSSPRSRTASRGGHTRLRPAEPAHAGGATRDGLGSGWLTASRPT
jgi:CobB/CobQ-like glutamine amidotransferase domain